MTRCLDMKIGKRGKGGTKGEIWPNKRKEGSLEEKGARGCMAVVFTQAQKHTLSISPLKEYSVL